MTNDEVSKAFESIGVGNVISREEFGQSSRWSFQASGFPIFIQTQESADRLRIVAQIGRAEDIDVSLVDLLDANYRTSMDARYALAGDEVVAAFLHPLSGLASARRILESAGGSAAGTLLAELARLLGG